jgi:hypothetical protein
MISLVILKSNNLYSFIFFSKIVFSDRGFLHKKLRNFFKIFLTFLGKNFSESFSAKFKAFDRYLPLAF